MNKDEIIRMAREAGIGVEKDIDDWSVPVWHLGIDYLERFANLVAAHAMAQPCCGNFATCQQACMPKGAAVERETIAKLLDEMAAQDKHSNYYVVAAKAIRARSNHDQL